MALRLLAHRRVSVALPDALPGRRVVVFDPRLERSHQSILNRLRGEDFSPGEADLLVVRGSHRELVDDLSDEQALGEFVGSLPVLALAGSHNAQDRAPALVAPSWAVPCADPPELDDLRASEVEGLLLRSQAIWRHEGCHYDLPSAAIHAEGFIRLADALRDYIDLVRLADWLLELVGPRTAIAADTGTLLALLLCVRDEARRRFHTPGVDDVPPQWQVPIAALDAYPRRPQAVRELVENFLVADWDDLLFVISVTSTGGLEARVRGQVPEARLAVICDTRPVASDAPPGDVFLRLPIQRWDLDGEETCVKCGDLQLLHIHPETYEITARLDWSPLGFRHARINHDRWFWQIVDRADAVRLHEDRALTEGSRESVRHLGVCLDIATLLRDDEFRASCLEKLVLLDPPDVVFVARHAASEPLRALAAEAWPGVATHEVGLVLGDTARRAVAEASAFVVLDDVCITGHTIGALRRAVYDISQDVGRPIVPQAFVVVSRPTSDAQWNRIRRAWMRERDGGMSHGLHCGVHVPLPPPGDAACPWCGERQLLQQCLAGLDAGAWTLATARVRQLQATPLSAPFTLAGVDRDVRTEGSIFGGLRPEAAIAAAASHAQMIKEAVAEERDASTIPVFNVELFLEAIIDAVLIAGTLRTLDGRHVRDPARQVQLARSLLTGSHDASVVVELAVLAADGRLPLDAVLQCIEDHPIDGDLADLARAVCQQAHVATS